MIWEHGDIICDIVNELGRGTRLMRGNSVVVDLGLGFRGLGFLEVDGEAVHGITVHFAPGDRSESAYNVCFFA